MNRKFKIYYYSIIFITLLIIIQEILNLTHYQVNRGSLILIFIMAIFSEILISESNVDTTVTLRGPLTLFSIMSFPLIWVYFFGISISFISKWYATMIKKEYEKTIDMKLIFNCSQSVIIIRAVSFFLENFHILEKSELTIFSAVILLSLLYVMVNITLVGVVVSLFSNKNSFKDYDLKELFLYYFYFFMIGEMLYFSYNIYGNFALLFSMFFVIPIQGTILNYYKIDDLNRMLVIDNLTGAYNRYYLEKYINNIIIDKKSFTLIFFDFDNFKEVNDKYGHLAGDAVLKNVVKELKKKIDKKGKVFRYGGDEFCIFLSGKDYEDFDSTNSGNILFEGIEIFYSYSVGSFSHDGKDSLTFQDVMKVLDRSMYENKNLRKNN